VAIIETNSMSPIAFIAFSDRHGKNVWQLHIQNRQQEP
jgi:hypothetical protein